LSRKSRGKETAAALWSDRQDDQHLASGLLFSASAKIGSQMLQKRSLLCSLCGKAFAEESSIPLANVLVGPVNAVRFAYQHMDGIPCACSVQHGNCCYYQQQKVELEIDC
jgi:hypothetical protein